MWRDWRSEDHCWLPGNPVLGSCCHARPPASYTLLPEGAGGKCCPTFPSHRAAFAWQVLSRHLRWQEYRKHSCQELPSALQDVLRRAGMLLTVDGFLLGYFVLEIFLQQSYFRRCLFSKHFKVLILLYVLSCQKLNFM